MIKSLNYVVSMFQNFIFKFILNLMQNMLLNQITHFYKFLADCMWTCVWKYVCVCVCVCVCVFVLGGLWLRKIFSSLYYPSFCFIPIPLKDKDVKWKFSQCKLQNASWPSFLNAYTEHFLNLFWHVGEGRVGVGRVEENLTSAHRGGSSSWQVLTRSG